MIFVIGGTGLVGSHLLFELTKRGEKIRALKQKSSKLSEVEKVFSYYTENYKESFKKIEWVEGTIMDIHSLEKAIEGADKVYHCAAIVSFFPREKASMMRINVEGTSNIVNACLDKKVKKLCFVSSVAALGIEGVKEIITEEIPWKISKLRANYSISKYGAEREVWRGIAEGLNAVIVNPAIILGPGNWHRGSPSMFRFLSKGNSFYPKGSGGYIDVRDVVKVMVELMEGEITNERFILVAENFTYKEFFCMVQEQFGLKKPSIPANKLALEIAWRLDKFFSAMKGKYPRLTKETIRAGNEKSVFSNNKIKKTIGAEFYPVMDSIKDICELYKKSRQ